MVGKGAGPSRSAFLSAFFTLVGMHGAHVTVGLLWLVYMAAQVIAKGLRAAVLRRLLCFSLFWHALDIVWIGVMTLGLSDGSAAMDGVTSTCSTTAPPVSKNTSRRPAVLSYTVGLGLAILATIASFVVSQTNLLWAPGIPVGLIVLALAQIGVHLVFFLHLGSGPDDTNNILALAFGRAGRLSHHRRLHLDHRQPQRQHADDAHALTGT